MPPRLISIFPRSPANGNFTVEIAVNRAFTTLSYDGVRTGVFGDGQNYTNGLGGVDCITELNSERREKIKLSLQLTKTKYIRKTRAWPQALRLPFRSRCVPSGLANILEFDSVKSDLSAVTAENLVVFTILYQCVLDSNLSMRCLLRCLHFLLVRSTPWRRIATYSVPNLPACPEAGCICAVRATLLFLPEIF